MPAERRRSTDLHIVPSDPNDMIALGAGAKDIRRDAQQLINIVETINTHTITDSPITRDLIQERLDAISITIKALQRRFTRR